MSQSEIYRRPKWMRNLVEAGVTVEQFEAFRKELLEAPLRITCGWNRGERCFSLMQVPKAGPTVVILHLGLGAMVDAVKRGAAHTIEQFELQARCGVS